MIKTVLRLVAVLATGLAFALLPSAAAQAAPGPAATDSCGSWQPATAERLTSNKLLGVYLQRRYCTGAGFYYKVAVHNYSSLGVGTRAYGITECDGLTINGGRPTATRLYVSPGAVYIPAYGAWASEPVFAGDRFVAGTIFRPRTSPSADYVPEVHTSCI